MNKEVWEGAMPRGGSLDGSLIEGRGLKFCVGRLFYYSLEGGGGGVAGGGGGKRRNRLIKGSCNKFERCTVWFGLLSLYFICSFNATLVIMFWNLRTLLHTAESCDICVKIKPVNIVTSH